jgi:superfamily II DNA or RNA helicase/HKD family nuclease
MPFIDNKNQTMLDALSNALETSDSVDICVGYFYFSGFQLLAKELKNKKVRILVGKELDPDCIPEIVKYSKEQSVSLDKYGLRKQTKSQLQMRQNYLDALVGFVNDSDTFDNPENESIFEMFISKLIDGTLEIRKTIDDYHGKFYVIHNKAEYSHRGDFPGTIFHGSSNFTYRGLSGQDELNDVSKEKTKFEDAVRIFDEHWQGSKSISIVDGATSTEFINELKEKLWIYQAPSPHNMYLRVLLEIYGPLNGDDELKTPAVITGGTFLDFQYQTDAIRFAIDRIKKLDGVIIADVVGLGKSIIAAAIAYNLDLDTLIISPPHLIQQWEDYKVEFRVRGPRVMSSGNIRAIYETYSDCPKPLLIIIDEAHRFRNEDTGDYQLLHQICRSNPNNKVVLLTATPFNNSPKDIFALIKLFQTPGQSTIRSIDNLSLRFRELIKRYTTLRKNLRTISQSDLDKEIKEIADEQRRYLEPVVIRRSRLDLEYVSRYRKDLERQKIKFPKIVGPNLLEYDLGDTANLYLETLEKISSPDTEQGFKGARYKPATYIIERDKFIKAFGEELDGLDLTSAQTNLSNFMRKLLVMRFESSREAFKISLERMIDNNRLILSWWYKTGTVPIMKKGNLPDPTEFSMEDGELGDDFEERLSYLREQKGLIEIPKEWMDGAFEKDVLADTELLEHIHDNWFGSELARDPKVVAVENIIAKLLQDNPHRKIVIFSSYADTVNYLSKQLVNIEGKNILSYTSMDASKENRNILLSNFDASLPENKQKNDYSILICTDALSEGVNLNRAGVIINFDIPYNPTRVIQRIGRINRINRLMYPEIHIFNCFPTVIGEQETRIKSISTLKICLINNVIGSDTRTLTSDEDVQSFFKDEFRKTDGSKEDLSWDAVHMEAYEVARQDEFLMSEVRRIPRRSRISRVSETTGTESAVVFSKKGDNILFVQAELGKDSHLLSIQEGLSKFHATEDEVGAAISNEFPDLFKIASAKLDEKHPLPEIRGRRSDAIKLLEALMMSLPGAQGYCADLIKVISKYDDVSEGALKDIAQSNFTDVEKCLVSIKRIVPESFIRNVLERIQRMEDEADMILLAEEFSS